MWKKTHILCEKNATSDTMKLIFFISSSFLCILKKSFFMGFKTLWEDNIWEQYSHITNTCSFSQIILSFCEKNATNDTKRGFLHIFSNYRVHSWYFQKFNTHTHIYNHLCIKNVLKHLGWGGYATQGHRLVRKVIQRNIF